MQSSPKPEVIAMSDEIEFVQVPLPEILQVRQLLEEFVSFFHQPLHYEDAASVRSFLEKGAYAELAEVFYTVTYNWLPAEVKEHIDQL
jgi:hypothetical protein